MLAIFLDTETNGLNFYVHRVLEIAFVLYDLDTHQEIDSYNSIVQQPQSIWNKSTPESLHVNGFTQEKMLKGQKENVVSNQILAFFKTHQISRKNAVFVCQNPSFDRAFFAQLVCPDTQETLQWPYHWLDLASMYWSCLINEQKRPWENGISKNQIAKHFKIANEELPHEAMKGVKHLMSCYLALFSKSSRN